MRQMLLTKEEEAMASGKKGPGVARCMEILIKFGKAFDAPSMVQITSAHTMPKEPIELLEKLTEGAAMLGAFTTLHPVMSAFSPIQWQKMGIPEPYARQELQAFRERELIYRRIGFLQTYTCLPMLVGNFPRKGDYVSWIGTGAQLMVNSLIGARCNRDGTIVNLASAITGCTPYRDLFLEENRYAEVVVRLDGLAPEELSDADFGAIGYHVGAIAGNRNVVFEGLSRKIPFEFLKYLMAPLSVSGSVSICHIVGVTPEAPSLEAALGHRKPTEIIQVGKKEISETKDLYALNQNEKVDMVVLGCPHCTILELKKIASILDGKKIGDDRRLWIGSAHQMYYLAQTMGYSQIIENAGGVISSSCMATIPDSPIPSDVKIIATNSFKASHYISRLTKGRVKVVVRKIDACIQTILN
jgi:predicted aconitase